MRKTGLFVLMAALPLAFARAASPTLPDLQEITTLLRANLPGLSDAELNHAEVEGLMSQLRGRAALVDSATETNPPAGGEVSRSIVLEGDTIYLRASRVGAGLPAAIADACGQMSATNKCKGVVLDLRFAGGDDYQAAADTAGLFVEKSGPLLNLGGQKISPAANKNVISLPLAVLVNGQTRGAAEALAGVLREAHVALLLGGHTGGGAAVMREFPLKDGLVLRIAATPVQYAGGAAFSPEGLEPDIAVDVNPAAEKSYFADAYAEFPEPGAATNSESAAQSPERERRISEADLVKARKAGNNVPEEDLEDAVPDSAETNQPVMHDPVLARAVDLVKGLALIRQAHGG